MASGSRPSQQEPVQYRADPATHLKWGSILVGLLVTIFAGLSKSDAYKDQTRVGTLLIVLGAVATAMAAAATTLNFANARAVYDLKEQALKSLITALELHALPKESFSQKFAVVRSWSANTKLTDAVLR
jgi:hypothetical protein